MTEPTGKSLLTDPALNKSTAFTREEREQCGLRGLLPYEVSDMESQKRRVLGNIRRKGNDIEKYIFLNALQDRNQRLFFRTITDHIEELLPLIYTPTVGQACKEFAHIFRQTQGLYITPEDRGEVRQVLDNWPEQDVRVIVMTDGERILGLGDLGANGMGIPIGKLALYVACGGIWPEQCLPLMLDVGTDNEELRADPLYLGWPDERLRGDAYESLMEELVTALQEKWPRALIQFEDFAGENAFELLGRYRDRVRMFNDDIQGTAAATLAGVYAANRITGQAYAWSEGRAIFASGSSFSPVEFEGKSFHPGQANNAYIFPGIGLGISVSGAKRVTEPMFLAAADAVADSVRDESLKSGTLFPPLSQIRSVSQRIAESVYEVAEREGLVDESAQKKTAADAIAGAMYEPRY